ncbi:hypothetical protein ACHAW5_005865 [Stephanodiscus triporus]|uniref:Reverse transcriptase Ty1/copia-type domain-containing protein n=1 Tax=Stephanodiscus triporus TaxID=2934178 RepID=A0ABD3Q752_9STRA
MTKAYKLPITEISKYTFNTGENKFAAQFTESCERVAGYVQQSGMEESYLVAETIRTGTVQTIALPAVVDPNDPEKADLDLIRTEVVKSVAKRRQKLEESLKKGYAMVYDQCTQEVRDKLKATKNWENIQAEQSLHKLIKRIEKTCVGFDDRKQSVFNLVQSLKTLFLYSQTEKELVEEYARNFRSLWDTVEAFGGSPGAHQGLVDAELLKQGITNPDDAQLKAMEEVSVEQVKAALLISRASRNKYGKLKNELANNYLLRMNQYPDTYKKAQRILSNYQNTRGKAAAGERQDGEVMRAAEAAVLRQKDQRPTTAASDDVSTMTGRTGGGGGEQEAAEDAHQLLNVTLTQGGELPGDRVYLDGCSTITAFKNKKYLKNIRMEERGVCINCNAVCFYKYEQGLPYINLSHSNAAGAMLLLQHGEQGQTEVALVHTVRGNYEGYTKHKILKAKEARRAQAMMGNPNERDYKGMLGVSQMFSPRELLLRWRLDYKKHCRVEPGTYCEVHDEPVPTNTMTPCMHKAIALGPTEPYEWTNEVPEDDPEFQGLLDENKDTAVYPDISAKLPGVELEEDEQDFQMVTAEPELEFHELAGAALHNAVIDAAGALQQACVNNLSQAPGPALLDGDKDNLVYEIMFDVPDARLFPTDDDPNEPLRDDSDDTLIVAVPGADDDSEPVGQRYPKYITADRKGTRILYVKLQKALYGLMRASLLFYQKLRKEFEQYGLVDNFELTKFSCHMGKLYGPNLSMHLGKKRDYLGVDMEFCNDGALEVLMIVYLKSVIKDFPELRRGRVATPAHNKLVSDRDNDDGRLSGMGGGGVGCDTDNNNRRRTNANKRYGFGGKKQKGRFKQNGRATLNDMSGVRTRGGFGGFGQKSQGGGAGSGNKRKAGSGDGNKRPGKRARDASRNEELILQKYIKYSETYYHYNHLVTFGLN